jgi:hypothetical protein
MVGDNLKISAIHIWAEVGDGPVNSQQLTIDCGVIFLRLIEHPTGEHNWMLTILKVLR